VDSTRNFSRISISINRILEKQIRINLLCASHRVHLVEMLRLRAQSGCGFYALPTHNQLY